MKTLLLLAILITPLFAVEDDGNPLTHQVVFEWVQEPSCFAVEKYKVTYWREGETEAEGTIVEVPSNPQVGDSVPGKVTVDGFEEGGRYQFNIRAVTSWGESVPTEPFKFYLMTVVPPPVNPKAHVLRP